LECSKPSKKLSKKIVYTADGRISG